jgi:hypothetical protein
VWECSVPQAKLPGPPRRVFALQLEARSTIERANASGPSTPYYFSKAVLLDLKSRSQTEHPAAK